MRPHHSRHSGGERPPARRRGHPVPIAAGGEVLRAVGWGAVRRLRDGYLATLKAPEIEEGLDLWFYRPLGYLWVLAFKRTSMTPDQISVLSMLFGLAAGGLFWLGTPASMAWGAAAVLVFNVLDCADGMLARVRGTGSLLGYALDGLCNYVASAAILIGLAGAAAARHDHPLLWWSLAVAAATSLAWWCSVVDGMRLDWMCRVHGRRLDRAAGLAELNDLTARWRREGTHHPQRLIASAYRLYVRLWESRPTPGGAPDLEEALPAGAWAEANRPILRMAVANGSSMQMTAIILAGLLNRPEWLFWAAATAGNAWAVVVLIRRLAVRRRLQSGVFAEV